MDDLDTVGYYKSESDNEDELLLQAASEAIATDKKKIFRLNEDDSEGDESQDTFESDTEDNFRSQYFRDGEADGSVVLSNSVISDQLKDANAEVHSLGRIDLQRNSNNNLTKYRSNVRTMGPKWSDVPVPELTSDVKYDIQLIRYRASLDSKRHYKKGILKEMPKLFQIGTILDSPYSCGETGRTRRLQSRTFAKDLTEDVKTNANIRKRFLKLQDQRSSFVVFNSCKEPRSKRARNSSRTSKSRR